MIYTDKEASGFRNRAMPFMWRARPGEIAEAQGEFKIWQTIQTNSVNTTSSLLIRPLLSRQWLRLLSHNMYLCSREGKSTYRLRADTVSRRIGGRQYALRQTGTLPKKNSMPTTAMSSRQRSTAWCSRRRIRRLRTPAAQPRRPDRFCLNSDSKEALRAPQIGSACGALQILRFRAEDFAKDFVGLTD
ncbi:MAG: hypothetical protein JWL77_2206 [Chthonomonadaceae bacterium]|nr:hypothetical protein [Chthonomonadaceae bacterium]